MQETCLEYICLAIPPYVRICHDDHNSRGNQLNTTPVIADIEVIFCQIGKSVAGSRAGRSNF
jgi:hypothetical protein